MSSGKSTLGRAAVAVLALLACTNTYLYDERNEEQVPADRTVAIVGQLCSPSPQQVVRPIKILLAMDASQSMNVTDPNGTRVQAMLDLMANLPNDDEIYISVLVFAGSTSAWLIANPLGMMGPEFHQLNKIPQNERLDIAMRLQTYAVPGNKPNRDSTDFVKPLADIYALVTKDIGETRLMLGNDTKARYSVIFLSDGHPTNPQDDELLCGDAVVRIRQLKDLADDVRVNTVFVFNPVQQVTSTVCDLDGGNMASVGGSNCLLPILPPGACPLLIVNQDADRLERMSQLGGGDFRDFRNNEPVNFLNFQFGQVRHTFDLTRIIASNFSAPPDSDITMADTDSDGLLDSDELKLHTNPWDPDTDHDGFSDGVEVYFAARGGTFDPTQMLLPDGTCVNSMGPVGTVLPDGGGCVDFGCPPTLRGVDSDCDGLNDCDEQLIGTNSLKVDSDDDGVPDAVEWQMKTSPSNKDLGEDPDNDQVPNGDELAMHTDPHKLDTAKLTTIAYRYKTVLSANVDDAGVQCYDFRIDNISLADTLADTRDAGNPDGGAPIYRRGEGYNDIYLSFSVLPGDDPTGHTLVRQTRFKNTRFPVGGIKSPPDGVIHVTPTDFVDQCGKPMTTP
jgi:hypothetical protein